MTKQSRGEADRELDEILARVTYIGPEPRPSEDEMMAMAADAVRTVRHAGTGQFRIVVEPDENRWRAYCPELEAQAAATWGRMPEEAVRHLREVLEMISAEKARK